MNNQAAQTMPEPDAYCAPYEPNNAVAFAWPGTDRAPMHIAPLYCQQKVVDAYQQGYAAALSQAAGVAQSITRPVESGHARWCSAKEGAGCSCDYVPEKKAFTHSVAAAPAASGGEDDHG